MRIKLVKKIHGLMQTGKISRWNARHLLTDAEYSLLQDLLINR